MCACICCIYFLHSCLVLMLKGGVVDFRHLNSLLKFRGIQGHCHPVKERDTHSSSIEIMLKEGEAPWHMVLPC